MLNPKELIEDFLALGYDDETAIRLAKSEFARKKITNKKNNKEAENKRICESRSFLAVH